MHGFGLVAQAVSHGDKFLVPSVNSGHEHITSAGIFGTLNTTLSGFSSSRFNEKSKDMKFLIV